ncbi:MAG: glutamine--tRNA ligase/YqeY domain fusion protein [Bacteroidetes bacterium]|nr:glutamine--tRNA ligase/YqeY domain fusion protein [Bacteroidota bacterium]
MESESVKNKEILNFIEQIIGEDIRNHKNEGRVQTRFPPEPNGYLHIGHAKSMCLNFGVAEKFGGTCNLRFDDTNPEKEDVEYVDSIKEDIRWLGFDWGDREFYASDYFDRLYEFAVKLIQKGKAYVDDLSSDEIAATKGTPTEPGKESPYRNRPVEENLQLFELMKEGKFEEGDKALRAKIDMASPNMHMRDPVIYRIKKVPHHRTGNKWNIYPMYDFAHGQSDAIEQVTYSLCTLEFESHRPLYDWLIENLEIFPSRQIEFARLNITNTVLSKRKLLELVNGGYVNGWDDPRMPTISGLRRRGYTPASIRNFADRIGVAKRDGMIDVALLEFSVREDLNKTANRIMGILDPVKVVITNYPEEGEEWLDAINNPENAAAGSRKISFSREIFIERSDFMVDPPRKFFRLGPGREVRLKHAYIIACEDYKKDPATGEVTEIYCKYDPDTRSGADKTGKKVKGTLSWVSVKHALPVEVRLYDRLFSRMDPLALQEGDDFKNYINPDSLKTIQSVVEPSVQGAKPGDRFQFLRQGYFCIDPDSSGGNLIFNRTATLRDTWAKKHG